MTESMVQFQARRRRELANGSPPATAIRVGKVGSKRNTAHLNLTTTIDGNVQQKPRPDMIGADNEAKP